MFPGLEKAISKFHDFSWFFLLLYEPCSLPLKKIMKQCCGWAHINTWCKYKGSSVRCFYPDTNHILISGANRAIMYAEPYFFLSSGSAGMALWSGANSSSWEITSLALTWTPEILNVGPFTFPLLPPDDQTRSFIKFQALISS